MFGSRTNHLPWFVEVFAVVPLGVSCFLSCRAQGYFVPFGSCGASRLFAAFGWRSATSGMGANAVVTKSTFFGVSKIERALLLAPPSRALTLVTTDELTTHRDRPRDWALFSWQLHCNMLWLETIQNREQLHYRLQAICHEHHGLLSSPLR